MITRFFSSQETIQAYLQKRTKDSTFAMLEDLCSNYTLRQSTSDELTELAYILFECMKSQLAQKDLLKLTGKWKDLSFVHIFRYLSACVGANKASSFLIVANLIKSLAQFDALFEAKLLTHFLLESEAHKSDEVRLIAIQKYADLSYTPAHTGKPDQSKIDFQFNPNSLISVKSLVSGVCDKVISHCQFKYLNWFMLQIADLMPCYTVDNQAYLDLFLQFSVPATQSKMVSQIRLQHIRLFEFGLSTALKQMPKTFMSQRCLWTLLSACCSAGAQSFKQKEPIGQIIAQALYDLIKRNKDEPSIQASVAGTIIGLQEFLTLLVHQSDYKSTEAAFWSFLDLYSALETLEVELVQERASEPNKQVKAQVAKQLRPLLREVAQIVLATFFQAGSQESHRRLLESVVAECDSVMNTDTSRQV